MISAPRLAIAWLKSLAAANNIQIDVDLRLPEGKWVGAGEPVLYMTGPLYHLLETETILLQKLGPTCVAAYNAYTM